MNIHTAEFIGRKLRPIELALLIKYILRLKRRIYTLPDTTKFYIDPISDFGLKLQKSNSYEIEMTNQITSILTKGDTFVDLGSNEGFFSVVASKCVGGSGQVFSIEPQQRLWGVIMKNIELNHLTNIQILPYGIGAVPTEIMMSLYPSLNSGASSLSKHFNFKISFENIRKKIYGQQKIVVKTLDDVLKDYHKKIKLLKIDIEGFEFEALKGAKDILEKGIIENLLIEIHPEALASLQQSEDEIINYLKLFGYKCHPVQPNLSLYQLPH